MAGKEAQKGKQEAFTKWNGRADDVIAQLAKELKAYSRRRHPFDDYFQRDSSTQAIIRWWKDCISEESGAVLLPYLAVKLYSMRVNSMSDERTASTFTWMTPATRSRMSIDTMSSKTAIYQFYRKEETHQLESQSRALQVKKFSSLKHILYGSTEPQKLTETKTAEEEVAESGEADDSWLDEEMEYGYSGPSDSLLHAAKFINPDSSELASIL
ncbi:hypothetical protein K435DRAFT_721210, partial [Dendrothele bispora CBS 962.96]